MSHDLRRILSQFWESRKWELICKAFKTVGEILPSIGVFRKVQTGGWHTETLLAKVVD